MFGHRLGSLFRFLIGTLVLQGATVLVTYTALQTDIAMTWPLFVALGASSGVLVTLWFESIAGRVSDKALSRAQQRHSREREKIRVEAERQRAKQTVKQTKMKGNAGIKLRTGIAVGGMAGVGVAMMVAQFMTVGLLTVATAGGAALGYGVRVRQERRLRSRLEDNQNLLLSEPQDRLLALEEQPSKRSRRKKLS
ncbi:hypothetical protein [Thiorhodovibrio frisius]|uniref:Transmembrane protein n=1 Tax=Thiorhodovibrio frisius TaxID=631362 RepID=H8Z2A1_9GAMM|nr:hypothetical protein [Thiorhodovibrio frisius]EIC22663.1 hypothetical protein Thi970DRAFT_02941 [Thiorhodovibrio frisius]WPL22419.1 hypothetical protein Thiofri_02583 [Thiorhodovibrio frisius]